MSGADAVLEVLRRRGCTLAVAESLTGGLLAAEIVAVPGASEVFRGSVTAYATDLKAKLLGVDGGLLVAEGAVHPDVAGQMAAGVRELLDATYGLSTTGVAGPEPQDGRPVGTVYVAVSGPQGTLVSSPQLSGDRATIRRNTVAAALDLIARALDSGQTG
jgi:nicotinamide-nucleotide amidase